MITTATLMDKIVQKHQLGPNQQNYPSFETMTLVVATTQEIYGFARINQDTPSFIYQIPNTNTISAVATVSSAIDDLIFFTTDSGHLYKLNLDGTLGGQWKICGMPLWSITSGDLNGQKLLFMTCADCTIRVVSLQGKLLGTIETLGRVLSLTVKIFANQTILVGGVQNQKRVLVWNLTQVIEKQNAMPMAILEGGRAPAFTSVFVEGQETVWLAHGCWDGYVYLYNWPLTSGHRLIHPSCTLPAASPIYTLQTMAFDKQVYILASTFDGYLVAWEIVSGKGLFTVKVAHMENSVRHMKIFKVDNQWHAAAINDNGRLRIICLTDIHTSKIVSDKVIAQHKVQGIAFL